MLAPFSKSWDFNFNIPTNQPIGLLVCQCKLKFPKLGKILIKHLVLVYKLRWIENYRTTYEHWDSIVFTVKD